MFKNFAVQNKFGATVRLCTDRIERLIDTYGADSFLVNCSGKYKYSPGVPDATIGDIDGDYRIFEHNNLGMIREMQKTLSPYVGRFCISRMAMTLHTDHKNLAANMAKTNIDTAFDGMIVEF